MPLKTEPMAMSNVYKSAGILLLTALVIALCRDATAKDNPSEQLKRAYQLEIRGRFEEALSLYREIYQKQPNWEDVLSGLERILVHLERYDELVSLLREEIRDRPEEIALRLKLGEVLHKMGLSDEAVGEWEEIIGIAAEAAQRNLGNHEILFRLALQCEEMGFYQTAAKAYLTLIERFPGSRWRIKAMLGLGRSQAEMGLHREAISSYQKLIGLFPENPEGLEALYRIGEIQLDVQRDVDGALASFQALSDKRRNNMWRYRALFRLGDCLVIKGKLSQAKEIYETIARERRGTSEDEKASFKSAEMDYFLGNFAGAIDRSESILARFPQGNFVNDALSLIVFIEENLGFEDDLKVFAQAQAWQRGWRAGQAVDALERLVAGSPSSGLADDALLLLGGMRAEAGDHWGAIETYEKLLLDYSSSSLCPQARKRIGEVYEEGLGELRKAAEEYERFLLDYPESILADEVRRRLKALRRTAVERALGEAG